jgi:hypothetical protein
MPPERGAFLRVPLSLSPSHKMIRSVVSGNGGGSHRWHLEMLVFCRSAAELVNWQWYSQNALFPSKRKPSMVMRLIEGQLRSDKYVVAILSCLNRLAKPVWPVHDPDQSANTVRLELPTIDYSTSWGG